jgi:hypothetical protein
MAGGKDLRVLVMTPTPQMHCASCENKIKGKVINSWATFKRVYAILKRAANNGEKITLEITS